VGLASQRLDNASSLKDEPVGTLLYPYDGKQYNISILHTAPRVMQINGFLSDAESDQIAAAFQKRKDGMRGVPLTCLGHDNARYAELRDAGLLENRELHQTEKGGAWLSCVDNSHLLDRLPYSSSSLFYRGENPIIDLVEDRIESMFGLPNTHAASSQILQYGDGAKYDEHTDCAFVQANPRAWTVLVYLSDVAQGGHTIFPLLNISAAPVKGSAVVFQSLHSNAFCDSKSTHASSEITAGTKVVLQKWFHLKKLGQAGLRRKLAKATHGGIPLEEMAGPGRGFILCDGTDCREYI